MKSWLSAKVLLILYIGGLGRFFSWMEIGPRNYGQHIFPKWFRVYNTYMLNLGFRFNWGRPHLTKLFSKEREIFITGYAGVLLIWAWWARKNKIRPLYRYSDSYLYDYDNPARFTKKYGMYVPFNYASYKISAHYIEINRLFNLEMMKKVFLN